MVEVLLSKALKWPAWTMTYFESHNKDS